VVVASDLHPLQPVNILLKYADDTYLLVGARYIQSAAAEFDNISRWAAANNLRLNPLKTKELIVRRKRTKLSSIPELPFIQGATRVTSLRVLGTTINSTLSMSDHIDTKLATCASSIYALRTLKKHELQPQQLHVVTRATTLNSLLYASPAWWGFASAHDRERLERLVNKLRKGNISIKIYLLFPPRSQKLIVAFFLRSRRKQTTSSLNCCPPERKPNTPSDPEHTNMCYHTRTRAIFPHVFYMAIYIVERTDFLMEYMPFRYHKIRKEIFIFLTFPISNVFFRGILSCVCVIWGVFRAN